MWNVWMNNERSALGSWGSDASPLEPIGPLESRHVGAIANRRWRADMSALHFLQSNALEIRVNCNFKSNDSLILTLPHSEWESDSVSVSESDTVTTLTVRVSELTYDWVTVSDTDTDSHSDSQTQSQGESQRLRVSASARSEDWQTSPILTHKYY